ncbi:ABC transporter ATP-binding protein [Aureibacillus halotolerans]|uniref:ABC-2 type transport system ATP-binding protein n=1 Tax=Aureibacillus halotolerans TaxID=1508390 RepID=A0A4R6U3C4_9BACI|nr:ABC transporter ATP-binding protein [Aureibacillus halotolerans]TDQ40890.1 ABC-2 type transport system ATP-binding protein [Aureibacillus halotolerans]
MTVVQMRNIVKRYKSHVALDHIDLDIAEGEIVGLLGPNGAGKTTLIHTLCGLQPFDSGTIQCFGRDLKTNLLDIKKQIGLVTQDITIFEDLTASENLAFFGGIYGLKGAELQKQIQETLEFVGLQDQARRLPTKFSGGMRRRLNIAAALTHRPKLLIMDEPTVGIDPQSRSYILNSIRELKQQGTTVLYTTHYMEEVQAIASRVVIIDQGHVIAEGTVNELIEKIQHEEKIKIEVGDPTEELLDQLKQLNDVKHVSLEGHVIHLISQAGSGHLDRVLSLAKNAGGVRSVSSDKPTLEDVFLTLTGRHLRDEKEDE